MCTMLPSLPMLLELQHLWCPRRSVSVGVVVLFVRSGVSICWTILELDVTLSRQCDN